MVHTDIFQRGVPWMVLLLHNRNAPSDLNLSHSSKLATFLAGVLALSLMALLLTGHAAALVPAAVFLLLAALCVLFAGKHSRGSLFVPTLAVSAPLAAYFLAPDPLAVIPLSLILFLVWTHLAFYRYVAQKRNSAFAFAVIPMQVIFFLGCAVSGTLGLIMYFFGLDREPSVH